MREPVALLMPNAIDFGSKKHSIDIIQLFGSDQARSIERIRPKKVPEPGQEGSPAIQVNPCSSNFASCNLCVARTEGLFPTKLQATMIDTAAPSRTMQWVG